MKRFIISVAVLLALAPVAAAQKPTEMTATATAGQIRQTTGPVVDIRTSAGDIKVRLYDDTPIHRDNFLKLAKEGYYDGVLFHRVISGFMVQAGDPDSREAKPGQRLGAGDPGYTLEAEIDYPAHYHKRGALAAARTGDQVNPERRSSGSQFYIVTGRPVSGQQISQMGAKATVEARRDYFRKLCEGRMEEIRTAQRDNDTAALDSIRKELAAMTENAVPEIVIPENVKEDYLRAGGAPSLDGQYTVFGEVIEGMDVVARIEEAATDRNDRPVEDIRILGMSVGKEDK